MRIEVWKIFKTTTIYIYIYIYRERERENPLFRQGLSDDNMSDKSECRNVESVKYLAFVFVISHE